MTTQQDILNKLRDIKEQLVQEYDVKNIGLFGSYARNEQTDDSDIDILIDLEGKIGIRFIDLADFIEDTLGIKTDVVTKKGLNDRYFQNIKNELIYV